MKRKPHWTYSELKQRKAVLIRDNYTCQIGDPGCTVVANTVDHIHPKAWGGLAIPENLRAACWNCNQRKGARAAGGGGSERAPRGAVVFRARAGNTAPLANPPPQGRWRTLTTDFTRREAERDAHSR